jgi:hypothetical protein
MLCNTFCNTDMFCTYVAPVPPPPFPWSKPGQQGPASCAQRTLCSLYSKVPPVSCTRGPSFTPDATKAPTDPPGCADTGNYVIALTEHIEGQRKVSCLAFCVNRRRIRAADRAVQAVASSTTLRRRLKKSSDRNQNRVHGVRVHQFLNFTVHRKESNAAWPRVPRACGSMESLACHSQEVSVSG